MQSKRRLRNARSFLTKKPRRHSSSRILSHATLSPRTVCWTRYPPTHLSPRQSQSPSLIAKLRTLASKRCREHWKSQQDDNTRLRQWTIPMASSSHPNQASSNLTLRHLTPVVLHQHLGQLTSTIRKSKALLSMSWRSSQETSTRNLKDWSSKRNLRWTQNTRRS